MPDHLTSLFIQTASAYFMTGLIWFVQIVHYPMFNNIDPDHFPEYERIHRKRTTWVVGPAMLIEAIATALTVITLPAAESSAPTPERAMLWIATLLLIGAWASTACIQVPCHHTLSKAFDYAVHKRLVRSNWIRTIAWTARAILLSIVLI